MTPIYCDVPEATYTIYVALGQRCTVTYREQQTLFTLHQDNGILWRTGSNIHYLRCIRTTVYCDVPEATHTIYVASGQRYTVTYRKQHTLFTLHQDHGILCRTGSNTHYLRCIRTTVHCDEQEATHTIYVASGQRYTVTYRKQHTLFTLH